MTGLVVESDGRPAPPQLGDVHLLNTRDGWQLYVRGELKREGLTTRQVTAIIRGELDIEALVEAPGMGRAG